MLTITYSIDGILNSDAKAEELAKSIYKNHVDSNTDTEILVACESLFTAFRMLVAEGKVDYQRIQFKYNEQIIPINAKGIVENWPRDFLDDSLKMHKRIVNATTGKNKFLV